MRSYALRSNISDLNEPPAGPLGKPYCKTPMSGTAGRCNSFAGAAPMIRLRTSAGRVADRTRLP